MRGDWSTVPKHNWEKARAMRREMTSAELRLWKAIRREQLGVSFRRQHPIGPYIADFFAPQANLVVEVDGDTHMETEQMRHDHVRDDYLRSRGLKIVRYRNEDVLNHLDNVLADIKAAFTSKCRSAAQGNK